MITEQPPDGELFRCSASKSVSGVLYWIVIYLDAQLPGRSSDLTRERDGPPPCSPIWSCSGWGLPSQTVTCLLVSSCLTVPPLPQKEAVYFCGTFLGVTPTGRYPAPCPMELRLSSGTNVPATIWFTCLSIIYKPVCTFQGKMHQR